MSDVHLTSDLIPTPLGTAPQALSPDLVQMLKDPGRTARLLRELGQLVSGALLLQQGAWDRLRSPAGPSIRLTLRLTPPQGEGQDRRLTLSAGPQTAPESGLHLWTLFEHRHELLPWTTPPHVLGLCRPLIEALWTSTQPDADLALRTLLNALGRAGQPLAAPARAQLWRDLGCEWSDLSASSTHRQLFASLASSGDQGVAAQDDALALMIRHRSAPTRLLTQSGTCTLTQDETRALERLIPVQLELARINVRRAEIMGLVHETQRGLRQVHAGARS